MIYFKFIFISFLFLNSFIFPTYSKERKYEIKKSVLLKKGLNKTIKINQYSKYFMVIHHPSEKSLKWMNKKIKTMPDSPMKKFLYWQFLQKSNANTYFNDIKNFLNENPQWPRKESLIRKLELHIVQKLSPHDLNQWFLNYPPMTLKGSLAYISNQKTLKNDEKFKSLIKETWVNKNFSYHEEKKFYKYYSRYLTKEDHWKKIDHLVWNNHFTFAKRILPYISRHKKNLILARIALAKRNKNITKYIKRVSKQELQDPGLLYQRLKWKRKNVSIKEAQNFLINEIPEESFLHYPEKWWKERIILIRDAMSKNNFHMAYKLASGHHQISSKTSSQSEWLAGWIALRFLDKPEWGIKHFTKLYQIVKYPISKARGAYWVGRCLEEMNSNKEAKTWYQQAGVYQHTYYGQLSIEKLGYDVKSGPIRWNNPSQEMKNKFDEDEITQIIRHLPKEEFNQTIKYFITSLLKRFKSHLEIAMIINLAKTKSLELMIYTSKQALKMHQYLAHTHISYPIHPLIKENNFKNKALLHALARQESLFHPKAKSHAGALGLMQLMPQTARYIAKNLNIKHHPEMLIKYPKYNIKLGHHYIEKMIDKWEGSYILALASYNAGPKRVEKWIKIYGDPRKKNIDPIDWIENIPYQETRQYLQRVLEGYILYQKQLNTNQSQKLHEILMTNSSNDD